MHVHLERIRRILADKSVKIKMLITPHNLEMLHMDPSVTDRYFRRRDVPGRIFNCKRTWVQSDVCGQGRLSQFVSLFSKFGGCGQGCLVLIRLVICPVDDRIEKVVFGARLQIEIILKAFIVIIGGTKLDIDLIGRILTLDVASFKARTSQHKLRQPCLHAETIETVVIESDKTRSGLDGKRQFQCAADIFTTLHSHHHLEIVFFRFGRTLTIGSLHQCRNITFKCLEQTGNQGTERIGACHLSIEHIGSDGKLAAFRLSRSFHLQTVEMKRRGSCLKLQILHQNLSLNIVNMIANEIGIDAARNLWLFIFVCQMKFVRMEMSHISRDIINGIPAFTTEEAVRIQRSIGIVDAQSTIKRMWRERSVQENLIIAMPLIIELIDIGHHLACKVSLLRTFGIDLDIQCDISEFLMISHQFAQMESVGLDVALHIGGNAFGLVLSEMHISLNGSHIRGHLSNRRQIVHKA